MEDVPLRVLFVDDEESYLTVVAHGLQTGFGCDVTGVSSGREALELLQSRRSAFDVVVLDYRMPDVSGLDVLRWMYEDKYETPAIVLTAAGSEEVAVEAMKLGAYDYARKDQTDLARLANLIRGVHERHLFRVAKAFEEDAAREMVLNREATDKVRDVINAITPALNSAFASIAADLEKRGDRLLRRLSPESRRELKELFEELRTHIGVLEKGVKGLLALYQIVHASHHEVQEIERIKRSFEEQFRKEPGRPE